MLETVKLPRKLKLKIYIYESTKTTQVSSLKCCLTACFLNKQPGVTGGNGSIFLNFTENTSQLKSNNHHN